MAFDRSVTLAVHRRFGESVWLMLCRSAWRGIHWSARALASDDTEERLDRTELLAKLGTAMEMGSAGPARHTGAEIDWAKLAESDRARTARELGPRWPHGSNAI